MTEQNVTASPLPFPSVPLEDQGVQALLALGRLNPSFAAAVVAQLESNPRQTISRLFNLTPAQQDAIDSSPDVELAARITRDRGPAKRPARWLGIRPHRCAVCIPRRGMRMSHKIQLVVR